MTQEQFNQLNQEIVKVNRQIEILNGPEFADTVPEVGEAKRALQNYVAEAQARVAEYNAQHAAPAVGAAPAAGMFGQVNTAALAQLVAALQSAAPAAAPATPATPAVNPAGNALIQALMQAMAQSPTPAAQG